MKCMLETVLIETISFLKLFCITHRPNARLRKMSWKGWGGGRGGESTVSVGQEFYHTGMVRKTLHLWI